MTVSRHAAIAALFLTTALPASALAQSDADAVDGILACRGIDETEARLACFDSAAARLAGDRESGELMTVTRSDVAAVEGDSFGFSMPSLPRLRMPRLAIAAADQQHDALEGAATVDMTDAAPAATSTANAPASPAAAAPAPAAPAAAATTTAAAETSVAIVERTDDGDVFRVEMMIERTRTVGYNTTVFHMTNGQVWRQTDTGRVRIPRGDGHTAEIRRGAMSSYLLRINGEGRAIRVERER
ncbi:hypothetical protein AWH62_10970 [Maricaulis sp. W15]|uniref:Uncharacterized protein n=1 Tax=Maricaulis maris TaxID=74318 RepID=A0A495D0X8_9PROT|nr:MULTISPECIES: hypothetical protein [Maricaulis]OLF72345.1 hypothetical protein AWH62_10970 [Maricaulis sp. W15]RKQ95182.1 hypothetical protein C7435_2869 [Maricaulis maris]